MVYIVLVDNNLSRLHLLAVNCVVPLNSDTRLILSISLGLLNIQPLGQFFYFSIQQLAELDFLPKHLQRQNRTKSSTKRSVTSLLPQLQFIKNYSITVFLGGRGGWALVGYPSTQYGKAIEKIVEGTGPSRMFFSILYMTGLS